MDTFPGDERAFLELQEFRGGWKDEAAVVVSAVGSGGIGWGAIAVPWIPIVAVGGILAARRWADALFLASTALVPLLNLVVKEIVARPRPDFALALVHETGHSFPSGHAVFSVAFLGALIWMLGRPSVVGRAPVQARLAQAALLLLVLAVVASRGLPGSTLAKRCNRRGTPRRPVPVCDDCCATKAETVAAGRSGSTKSPDTFDGFSNGHARLVS